MREVGKAEFRDAYFRYGGGRDGWTAEYWQRCYETGRVPPMRYCVEEPQCAQQTRMMIVDDYAAREHRLFLVSEEAEECLFAR